MKNKMKKRLPAVGIVVVLIVVFLLSPAFPYVRSQIVMKIYSMSMKGESLAFDTGMDISIPGGTATKEKDWYPFVMTYNADDEFARYIGRDARLTILYNFGDFTSGASSLYDPNSAYYNSFYGAYLVQEEGTRYGFAEDGSLDPEEVALVPRFDLFELVLDEFGLNEADGIFEWDMRSIEKNWVMAGSSGWTRALATVRVSSVNHTAGEWTQSYLQYGKPKGTAGEAFAPVELQAVVYAKHFSEQNVSVFLYAMCADATALLICEQEILSQTEIRND